MLKVAIASGKGGTGKTTLSVNLINYIAEKKLYNKNILVDLDVEEPNSSLFIKEESNSTKKVYKKIPKWNIEKCNPECKICSDICRFNAVLKMGSNILVLPNLCHSCFACSELCPNSALPMEKSEIGKIKEIKTPTFDFIESRLNIGEEKSVPLITKTIKHIEKNYSSGIAILDSPPGSSCPVIEVTKNSDLIILVTEPTPFGLHDLKLAVQTLKELKKHIVVVINKYGIGNDDVIDYCKKENIEIIAKLPNMKKIAQLYSKGELIYKEVPEFKYELKKIYNYINVFLRSKKI